MPRFAVLANGATIGYSELKKGDPPMGCASGRFFPLPTYAAIQPISSPPETRNGATDAPLPYSADGRWGRAASLTSPLRFIASPMPAQGGVAITGYSAELGPNGIEVDVLGIGYPLYEELSPDGTLLTLRISRTNGSRRMVSLPAISGHETPWMPVSRSEVESIERWKKRQQGTVPLHGNL